VSAPDAQGMRENIRAIPDHLRDALWRIESARLRPSEAPAALVCGMGGSAIGGDLAAAALGDRLARPLLTVRGYGLPSWSPAGSAVLCSSYSGETEETLACFDAAEALGAQRVVATTGGKLAEAARAADVPVVGLPSGMQPRAAVGYMFAVAAEHARNSGAAPGIHAEIDATAAQIEERFDTLSTTAAELAERIGDAIPVIHGADLTAPVAYRWKGQVNENAKLPAFRSELPEANHNEIASWDAAGDRFAAVMLLDSDQHPRIRRRFEVTGQIAQAAGAATVSVEAEGETRTCRLLEMVTLGDLVSLELAARRGVDPTPIEAIEGLKAELGAP
jgi:glucose/mannose-6-phosphate isomerase